MVQVREGAIVTHITNWRVDVMNHVEGFIFTVATYGNRRMIGSFMGHRVY